MLTANPAWGPPPPDVDLQQVHSQRVLVLGIVLLVISNLTVGLRFFCRRLLRTPLWWDDLLIALALLTLFMFTLISIIWSASGPPSLSEPLLIRQHSGAYWPWQACLGSPSRLFGYNDESRLDTGSPVCSYSLLCQRLHHGIAVASFWQRWHQAKNFGCRWTSCRLGHCIREILSSLPEVCWETYR